MLICSPTELEPPSVWPTGKDFIMQASSRICARCCRRRFAERGGEADAILDNSKTGPRSLAWKLSHFIFGVGFSNRVPHAPAHDR
jgi:hypothetical protein